MTRNARLLVGIAVLVSPQVARTQAVSHSGALAAHQQLARDVYQQLIEINTVDGVGGTTPAAEAVAKRFRDAGFSANDVQVLGARPDKGNVVVRYRGSGTKKPLLLLAHLDVVQALKSDWSPDIEPFKLTERDGYFYGRGTSDDKAMAAIFVANLLRMKREGFVPNRDLILALTADEEGGTANGVEWLLANRRDLIDAELALNEGGGGALKNGKPFINSIGAAEKVYTDFTLTARNRGGHSSVPRPDNAIYELATGLTKLASFSFPVTLNEVTRAFFARTAAIEQPELAAAMRALVADPRDSAAAAVVSRDPRYNSMLRTTCVATRLAGGHANNALPQTATANVNCRMLPGHDPADVRAGLIRALGDTGIDVSPAPAMQHAAPSPLTPEFLGAVERVTRQLFGDIPVIPTMGTGATDSKYLRAAGIPGYGVSGIFGDPNDSRAHGRDERVLVKSFYDGQEFLYRLVKMLASPPSKTVS
jgi:acetylornithine deacetylase/succinyl-diaminopimelate desuccinylase-like protein